MPVTASIPFLAAARGESAPVTPVWFMRQAGRSLPEYRAIRGEGSILDAIKKPDVAAEITLQPVRRYGVDAAVLYRVVHEDPDLTALAPELRELAAACLRKDPAQRPGLADVIEACRTGNDDTSLKVSGTWLPAPHIQEIHRRTASTFY